MLNCYIFIHLFHNDWAGEFRYENTLSVGPIQSLYYKPKVAKLVFYTQGAQSSQWSEEFYDLRTIVWGLNSYRNDNEFREDDFGASRAWYLYNPGIVCGYFTCQTRAKPPLNVILILELLPYILIKIAVQQGA